MPQETVEVVIETQGAEKIERALRMLRERSVNTRPLMQRLGVAMVGIVDRNFEAEGRPTKWKKRSPLTQATLAVDAQNRARQTKRYKNAKRRGQASILRRASLKAMGNKILSREGDLKKSITYEADVNSVAVGPGGAIPYARIHQLGGVIVPKKAKALLVPCGNRILRLKKVTIPARPYLVIPGSEMSVLPNVAVGYLEGGVTG